MTAASAEMSVMFFVMPMIVLIVAAVISVAVAVFQMAMFPVRRSIVLPMVMLVWKIWAASVAVAVILRPFRIIISVHNDVSVAVSGVIRIIRTIRGGGAGTSYQY